MNVAIVTDSCASLPDALFASLNIHWAAYYIHRGQEVLRDLLTVQRGEFLRWLGTAKFLPTTASPGPGDYLALYQKLAANGVREIISIHMTSLASGAYQAACIAQSIMKEALPEMRIEVIDTRNVSLCQGWMAIEAARGALMGKSLEELTAVVRKMMPVTHMIQTADTLKYLYMGGRIGRAQHLMGTLLNVKPLIGMNDGVIIPLGKARNRRNAFKMMVDKVEQDVGAGRQIKAAFVHAGAPEEAEQLRQMVEGRVDCVETLTAELSPALMVHTGPGTVGLCYFPAD